MKDNYDSSFLEGKTRAADVFFPQDDLSRQKQKDGIKLSVEFLLIQRCQAPLPLRRTKGKRICIFSPSTFL